MKDLDIISQEKIELLNQRLNEAAMKRAGFRSAITIKKTKIMSKLNSFEYKGMIFHNVKDNLFQTDRFGDKLIYKFENGKYHLVKDERLSAVITSDELSKNPNSLCNNDYWWK